MHTHYVPQYYLKGFCSAATPATLSRYEKGSRKILTTTTKNLAQQRNLYPAEVEEFLATQIEQPANAVLDRIRDRVPLAVEDKAVLASYMMALLKKAFLTTKGTKDTKKTQAGLEIIRRRPQKKSFVSGRRQSSSRIIYDDNAKAGTTRHCSLGRSGTSGYGIGFWRT
jgi:hypothetical protein